MNDTLYNAVSLNQKKLARNMDMMLSETGLFESHSFLQLLYKGF